MRARVWEREKERGERGSQGETAALAPQSGGRPWRMQHLDGGSPCAKMPTEGRVSRPLRTEGTQSRLARPLLTEDTQGRFAQVRTKEGSPAQKCPLRAD